MRFSVHQEALTPRDLHFERTTSTGSPAPGPQHGQVAEVVGVQVRDEDLVEVVVSRRSLFAQSLLKERQSR